jgi:hypothetical protein
MNKPNTAVQKVISHRAELLELYQTLNAEETDDEILSLPPDLIDDIYHRSFVASM